MTNILIFAEIDENGVTSASKEIISYCVNNFKNSTVTAITLVAQKNKPAVEDTLCNLGLDNLYILINDCYEYYSTETYTNAIVEFLNQHPQDIFLIAATPQGRDFAPRVASRMNIGLTADCTEIGLDESNMLLATRPTYGGKLLATILSKTTPQFATIRPGALKLTQDNPQKTTKVEEIFSHIEISELMCEVLSFKRKRQDTDWTNSDIIVAGGKGLGSKENFDLVYELCEVIGAKPAASRCAVELGWADTHVQVGQTGYSVSPKIYLAFGISGAMQHLVGIENADKIIAINTDKNAPIMAAADISINADAVETIKSLIDEFRQAPL